jgi:hypothetical protein
MELCSFSRVRERVGVRMRVNAAREWWFAPSPAYGKLKVRKPGARVSQLHKLTTTMTATRLDPSHNHG